jgi:hypothetical protein
LLRVMMRKLVAQQGRRAEIFSRLDGPQAFPSAGFAHSSQ